MQLENEDWCYCHTDWIIVKNEKKLQEIASYKSSM